MTEDQIEQDALRVLAELGWEIVRQTISDQVLIVNGERTSEDVVLGGRVSNCLRRLNPEVPSEVLDERVTKITRNTSADLVENNRAWHRLLTDGMAVEYRDGEGNIKHDIVRIFDFDNPPNNNFLAVNQLTIAQDGTNKRPDIVLFVNGLPLVVIELKNPGAEKADMQSAYNQIQTYKAKIPNLFRFNEICVIADGLDAYAGTITSNLEWFNEWKTIDGTKLPDKTPLLEPLLRGMFDKNALLNIVQNFIVFKADEKEKPVKILAAYHQYWVVNKALGSTSAAMNNDHKAGVVWHTQGSGKSFSMVFYAGKLISASEFKNPTIVVVTDRIDLDGQLFSTFSSCRDLLRQDPVQAESREDLKKLLDRDAGGVIFTTIQKFDEVGEPISQRKNIIVIADEAHRSQYGFNAHIRESDMKAVYGNAKYMHDALPNASFIGFTGTPIELSDRSTPAVFGNYIDIYDIKRAVDDGATVPIYYESRLIDLGLDETTRKWLDEETDGLLEGEDENFQNEMKVKAAQKEAIVGNSERLKLIAEDIVNHFETRLEAFDGKGMIVTMSREIAVNLYAEIIARRPEWHSDDNDKGMLKIVMTGSSADPALFQPHLHGHDGLKTIERRFKNSDSDLKLVIVCDMWLTGFDVPSLHTMYLDKPLKAHNLMQAIARVNRVHKDKTGGLVVDYLGVAGALREALETYTVSGGQGAPTLDIDTAIVEMRKRYEVVRDFFHGFDYRRFFSSGTTDQLQIILDAQDFVLNEDDGKKRYRQIVLELYKAYCLVAATEAGLEVAREVAFFQIIKSRLTKLDPGGISEADYKAALRQIVDKAIAPLGVVDVFEAAGLGRPNLSILSDEFLAEMKNMKRKNLAIAALEKLLKNEIRSRFGANIVKIRKFSELLESALAKYKNGTIEAAKVIEELITLAKNLRSESEADKNSDLTPEEKLFYDALVENDSAKEVMADDQLREIARILVQQVRSDISIDWRYRPAIQAKLKVNVKKTLAKYGYPPDQQKLATNLVMEQAKAYGDKWSANSYSNAAP
jgi:type I restriction enzyme R subunit